VIHLREHRTPRRNVHLLAGSIAVTFMLATTRWGSHIGIQPIYLTDVIVAGALLHAAIGTQRHRPRNSRTTRPFAAMWPVVLLCGWIAIRLILSLGTAPILDVLRDAVPFAYGLLALLSAWSYSAASGQDRNATAAVLTGGLIAHLAWVLAVVLGAAVIPVSPGQGFGVPPGTLRPDIDGAFAAVIVAIAIQRVIAGNGRVVQWVVIAACGMFAMTSITSRAPLLSLALTVGLAVTLEFLADRGTSRRRTIVAGLLPLITVVALAGLGGTTAGERLLSSVGITEVASVEQARAQGTTTARSNTWATVVDWTEEDAVRTVFGSGFGTDFMAESGAEVYVEGTVYTDVRSPHNWFVTVYARLGVVGLMALATVLIAIARAAWMVKRDVVDQPLVNLSLLVVVSILPVATFGVILESPFGAIPYFWCAGVLLASAQLRARPMPTRRLAPRSRRTLPPVNV